MGGVLIGVVMTALFTYAKNNEDSYCENCLYKDYYYRNVVMRENIKNA